MWKFWLIAAGIFFVLEMSTIGFLVFWLGVGALLTALVSLFVDSLVAQTAVFVISSTLLIFATRPLVKKISKDKPVPTNVYSIVGKQAIVTEEINWEIGTGLIKCSGEVWSAKTKEQVNIPKGTKVEIISIEGVKAFVRPIEEKETAKV